MQPRLQQQERKKKKRQTKTSKKHSRELSPQQVISLLLLILLQWCFCCFLHPTPVFPCKNPKSRPFHQLSYLFFGVRALIEGKKHLKGGAESAGRPPANESISPADFARLPAPSRLQGEEGIGGEEHHAHTGAMTQHGAPSVRQQELWPRPTPSRAGSGTEAPSPEANTQSPRHGTFLRPHCVAVPQGWDRAALTGTLRPPPF